MNLKSTSNLSQELKKKQPEANPKQAFNQP